MTVYKPAKAQLHDHGVRRAGVLCELGRDQSGAEVLEFGLVLIPLIALVFVILDISWVVFAQESLQHGVQVGVRAAITGNAQPADIKALVQSSAMGFLGSDQSGLDLITVQCYQPTSLTPAACSGGSVIEVSVDKVPVSLLGPIIGSNVTKISLSANSSDIMESITAGQ